MSYLASWRRDKSAPPLAPDRQALLADESAFFDLEAAEATRLAPGELVSVGRVAPAARAALGDRGVAELLVQADLVHIWAHVEGTAHLVRESAEEGRYTASFIGSHMYFTNVCNEAHFAFDLAIDAQGAITVTGR